MAQEQTKNPIYDYLKSEGVTDLSEADFIAKYTDRTKLKEVYDWLKSNENTDLEFEPFADKYFPLPKSNDVSTQGSESTSVISSEPLVTSQNGNPELEAYIKDSKNWTNLPDGFRVLNVTPEAENQFGGLGLIANNITGKDWAVRGSDGAINIMDINSNRDLTELEASVQREELTPWESVKNSVKNMGTQLRGFDDRLTVATQSIYSALFGEDTARKIYDFLEVRPDSKGYLGNRDEALTNLQRLGEETLPTLGIIESSREGDLAGVSAGVVNGASAVVSTLLTGALTFGGGIASDMLGGAVYDYNSQKAETEGLTTQELFNQGKADLGVPLTIGAIGTSLELFGIGGVTRGITSKLTGTLSKKATILGLEMNKEGMTEYVQFGLDAYSNAKAKGLSDSEAGSALISALGSEQGIEMYLQGMAGSASAIGGGRLAKGILSSKTKSEITKKGDEIIEIGKDIANIQDPTLKSTLLDKASTLAEEITTLKNQESVVTEQMSPEQLDRVTQISNEMDSIDTTLANAENSENEATLISDSTKSTLEQRKKDLASELDNILKDVNTEESSAVPVESSQVERVGTETATEEELVVGNPDQATDSVQQNEPFTEPEQAESVNTASDISNELPSNVGNTEQNLEVEGNVPTPTEQRLSEIRTRREEIRSRIRQRFGNLNAGINPEQLGDFIELGATYVEEGVVRFSDWATKLQQEIGDKTYNKLSEQNLRDVFRQSVEANGLRVRGFTESARTNPNVSRTTQAIVDATSDTVTYNPQVLEELKSNLDNLSEQDKLVKVNQLSNVTNELSSEDNDAVLAGINLINQYEAEGRNSESAKIIEQMAKSATVIGQALRQYGEFKNSTPQGYISLVEGWLKEKGKELNPINRSKIETLFKNFQIATDNLNKANEKRGSDLSKQTRQEFYKREIELEKANRELADYISKVYGKDLGDVLSQILQGNLLTLKSLIINPFSNIVQGGIRFSNNTVAWGMDNMFKIFFPQLPSSKISPFDPDAIRLGSRATARGTSKAFRKAVYGDASTELNKYDVSSRLKPFTAISDLIKNFTSEDFRAEFPQDTETLLSNLAEGTLGINANLMFRMLPFGDDPFYQQARTERLVEIGKTNKGLQGEELEKFVNNPDAKSEEIATEYAKEATFQDATALARFLRQAMKGINDVLGNIAPNNRVINATSKVLVKATIPFVGTPSSILVKTIRFANPWIPMIQLVSQWGQFAKLLKASRTPTNIDKLTNIRRKISETTAEVVVSGAVITTATMLVSLGLASGDMPDEKERAKEKNFGFATMPFNHLNISGLKRFLSGGDPTYKQGDRTISYIPLGLLGAQIGIVESTLGTKLREDFKKKKVLTTSGEMFYNVSENNLLMDYMRNFFSNLPASVKYFMNQSFVQSTETLVNTLTTGEFDQYGNQMIRTLSNLGIPNQASQYFRATNEYMRDIYTEEDLQTYTNIIKEKVGNVEDLPKRYNMWGDPVKQSPDGTNPYVYQMLDIFRSQKILEDDLTYKVFDLYKKTHDSSVIPTGARDFFNERDFTIKLNKEQKSELVRIVGEERRRFAEKALRSYTDDSTKLERYVKLLKKAYSDGAKLGKKKFLKQLRDQGIDIRTNISLKTSSQLTEAEKLETEY